MRESKTVGLVFGNGSQILVTLCLSENDLRQFKRDSDIAELSIQTCFNTYAENALDRLSKELAADIRYLLSRQPDATS